MYIDIRESGTLFTGSCAFSINSGEIFIVSSELRDKYGTASEIRLL